MFSRIGLLVTPVSLRCFFSLKCLSEIMNRSATGMILSRFFLVVKQEVSIVV